MNLEHPAIVNDPGSEMNTLPTAEEMRRVYELMRLTPPSNLGYDAAVFVKTHFPAIIAMREELERVKSAFTKAAMFVSDDKENQFTIDWSGPTLVNRITGWVAKLEAELATAKRQRDDHIRDKHRILAEYDDKVKRLEAELAAAKVDNERLKTAWDDARDTILNKRHECEEPCLDNDQTNAVLSVLDRCRDEAEKP